MPKQATERAIDTPFSKRSSGSGTIVSASGTATSIPVHGLESIYHTGNLDSRYYTESELNAGQLNSLYYTEAELNAGQLDSRYYTEAESNALFVPVTRTVTGSGALGGGGALSSNQTVTLNTPGSLTATTTNSSVTNHTHAIDSTIARSAITFSVSGLGLSGGGNLTANRTITLASSSNPGAAASLLASSTSGGLQLVTLTTTGAISGATNTNTAHTLGYATVGYVGFAGYAGFAANAFATSTQYSLIQSNVDGRTYLNSASGTDMRFRINNVDTMIMDANGLNFVSGKLVGSSGYVSGWAGSGWRADQNLSVSGQSFAEFDNLSVRGTLSVYELVINQIRATNGTLIVSSAGKIDSVSGSNWTFEDPNASNLCAFAVNDLVIIQSVDVNASTIVKRIVRKVSAVSGKTITVTTASGAPADTGTAVAGDTVVRFGNTSNAARQGVVLITSDMSNSPYQDVISGVTSWADWTGGTKTRVRLGHLSGITGTANEYGFIAGDGYTSSDSYLKLSTSGVLQNNVNSAWYNSGTKIVVINTAKGIDINAFGTGYDAIRSYSFSDGTTYRGGLQAYLNAGETQVKMHSLGPGVASIATVLAENTATNATAQVSIAATNSQTSRTASISLIASSAAHEVDVSADLIALSANKIHITNGTAADGSASAPILSFLNDADTGIYRAGANQLNFTTGGVERMAITASSVSAFWDTDTTHTFGRVKIGYVGHGDYAAFAHYDQANSTSFALLHQSDGRLHLNGASGTDIYFKIGNSAVMRMNATGLNVGDGSAPSYTLDVRGRAGIRQLSTTAAVPTLILTQSDVSEEFIDFSSTIGAGNAIDTAALGSYYGKVRVSVNGTFKWLALYD